MCLISVVVYHLISIVTNIQHIAIQCKIKELINIYDNSEPLYTKSIALTMIN